MRQIVIQNAGTPQAIVIEPHVLLPQPLGLSSHPAQHPTQSNHMFAWDQGQPRRDKLEFREFYSYRHGVFARPR